jgi:hypothetical protein
MNDASHAVHLVSFVPHYRASVILLHITSLPSPIGAHEQRKENRGHGG